tara:strand:+ start:801 stop:1316 length:516 start_codon:yes stop_codon:yes gene_type:complete
MSKENLKKTELHLTVDKEWLLENHPNLTLKEMCKNKMIKEESFIEETGRLESVMIDGKIYTTENEDDNYYRHLQNYLDNLIESPKHLYVTLTNFLKIVKAYDEFLEVDNGYFHYDFFMKSDKDGQSSPQKYNEDADTFSPRHYNLQYLFDSSSWIMDKLNKLAIKKNKDEK